MVTKKYQFSLANKFCFNSISFSQIIKQSHQIRFSCKHFWAVTSTVCVGEQAKERWVNISRAFANIKQKLKCKYFLPALV